MAMASSDGLPHAVAGAAGGVVSSLLTYPLQTISSRLSVQSNDAARSAYRSAPDALRKILETEGVAGLYSGLGSAIFGIAVTNAIYYFFYETTKRALEPAPGAPLSTLRSMLTGAVAGSITTITTNPIWVINTRMTVKRRAAGDPPNAKPKDDSAHARARASSDSALATLLVTIREDGVLSLWQGLLPALILVSNPIIQYTVFEQMKQRIELWRHRRASGGAKLPLTPFHFFLLGATSKLCASVATYPYVLIKSRMQLRKRKGSGSGSVTDGGSASDAASYASVLDAFRKIVATEGPKGLFKGLGSKLLQSTLAAAILFAAKEQFFEFAVWLLVTLRLRKQKLVTGAAAAAAAK